MVKSNPHNNKMLGYCFRVKAHFMGQDSGHAPSLIRVDAIRHDPHLRKLTLERIMERGRKGLAPVPLTLCRELEGVTRLDVTMYGLDMGKRTDDHMTVTLAMGEQVGSWSPIGSVNVEKEGFVRECIVFEDVTFEGYRFDPAPETDEDESAARAHNLPLFLDVHGRDKLSPEAIDRIEQYIREELETA